MNDDDRGRIRRFISGHVNGLEIGDDEDLFAAGHVNSLFAVQLVMWIERTFDVPVESEDLDFANFQTISAVAAFVARKRVTAEQGTGSPVGGVPWTSD